MAKTASMCLRIDPQIKTDVEAIYSRYGMSLSEAITVFLYQSRNIGGLPFDLRPAMPNTTTLAAIEESNKIVKSGKARYKKADDLLKELKA